MDLFKRFVLLILLFVFPMLSYAALPPEVQKDRALMSFSEHLKNEQYKEAEKDFRKLIDLRDIHKVKLPSSVYYFGAETVQHTGYHLWAETLLTKYITIAGQKGKYYTKALQLLDVVEPKAKEEREKKAAKRKLQEDWESREKSAAKSFDSDLKQAQHRQQKQRTRLPSEVLEKGFVLIPSGRFQMGGIGNDNERPIHTVQLKAFAMAKYEVTFTEYDAYCDAKGKRKPSDNNWGRGNRPVINVSWQDAKEYAQWLGQQKGKRFRLPTEAEWEYAARAGSRTTFSFKSPLTIGKANYVGDRHHFANYSFTDYEKKSPGKSMSVGSFQPNAFGLYDIHGNVSEWVEDSYHDNYKGAPSDGSAWERRNSKKRVVRGGSWNSPSVTLRSSNRQYGTSGNWNLGFRLVQDISEEVELEARKRFETETAAAKKKQSDLANQLGPDFLHKGFVIIPSRSVQIGDHIIKTKPFGMSRFELTVAEFTEFIDEVRKLDTEGIVKLYGGKIPADKVEEASVEITNYLSGVIEGKHGTMPVGLDTGGNGYIKWLSEKTGKHFRRPTDVEWEYAARAGVTTDYFCGNDESCLTDYAWFSANSNRKIYPVGKKLPNPFGLYDVYGNVDEYVDAVYEKNKYLKGGNAISTPEGFRFSGHTFVGNPGVRLVQEFTEEELEQEKKRYAKEKVASLLASIEMADIPAGNFIMGDESSNIFGQDGDEDELPGHPVNVASFKISKHEITFQDYDVFCELTGREKPEYSSDERAGLPVVNVSWEDAKAFTKWLSEMSGKRFRLPTEAEWEYASRAGTDTKYSWGRRVGKNSAVCDGCKSQWDKESSPAPVGSFEANAFGLNDMHGNVWEWVEDCYHENYQGAPVDGTSWSSDSCSERVIRGGGWSSKAADLRSANRGRVAADHQGNDVGFRIVLEQ